MADLPDKLPYPEYALDHQVWQAITRLSQPVGTVAANFSMPVEEVAERWRRHNDFQHPPVDADTARDEALAKLADMDRALAVSQAAAEKGDNADELRRFVQVRLGVADRVMALRQTGSVEGGDNRLAEFLGELVAGAARRLEDSRVPAVEAVDTTAEIVGGG